MRECYDFEVETYVTHIEEVRVTTNRAEVILIPDTSASNQLRSARVVLREGVVGGEKTASKELVRVLVGYGYPSTKMIDPLSSPRMIRGHRERGSGKRNESFTKTSNARIVKRYDPQSPKALRIDVDSGSPAIVAYYEAMMTQGPFDRCLGLFKVIEFFCVGSDRSTEEALRRELKNSWWIPPHAERKLIDLMTTKALPHEDAAAYLWRIRSGVSHLKHSEKRHGIRFGVKPRAREDIDEVSEVIEILRETVRYTLEQHPDTREHLK